MIRRPPRSTQSRSSAASDVYKRQVPVRDIANACGIRPRGLIAAVPESPRAWPHLRWGEDCREDRSSVSQLLAAELEYRGDRRAGAPGLDPLGPLRLRGCVSTGKSARATSRSTRLLRNPRDPG